MIRITIIKRMEKVMENEADTRGIRKLCICRL